jgi:hypothetical protein
MKNMRWPLLALLLFWLPAAAAPAAKPPPTRPQAAATPKVNTAGMSPQQLIDAAQQEIKQFHTGTADQYLQAVIDSPGSSAAQIEDALVLQMVLYYGDVIGAMTIIPSLARVGKQGSPLKDIVGKQLVLARRAFAASMNGYLNNTVRGQQLRGTDLQLPEFTNEDAKRLGQTMADAKTLDALVSGFAKDPAPGRGLLSKANLMGLYVSAGSLAPYRGPKEGDHFKALRSKLAAGVDFNAAQYLDWASTACLEMKKMLRDPGGPDMAALSQRCDERILQWYGKDPSNAYVKAAQKRLGKG